MLYAKLPPIILIGVVLMIASWLTRLFLKSNNFTVLEVCIALSWIIPIIVLLSFQPVMYDGLRHFIFIIPPLGISISIALYYLVYSLSLIFRNIIFFVFLALLSMQVWSMIKLHPYQYAYTNFLVDGNDFEADYWGISFKQIAEFINLNRSEKGGFEDIDLVFVCGPSFSLSRFLPDEIEVVWERGPTEDKDVFLVALINRVNCYDNFKEAETVHEIFRDDVSISKLKIFRNTD